MNTYWIEHKAFVLAFLRKMNEEENWGFDITDVTWHNDICPSLQLESETQDYTLFLPNSHRNDGEEVNTYMLIHTDDYGFLGRNYLIFETAEQLVNHINANLTEVIPN